MLDSDARFLDQIAQWKSSGIISVAMDFEGEFNLHIYGEHLCLIQLFDGSSFFLADPFNLSEAVLRTFFEEKDMEKIMGLPISISPTTMVPHREAQRNVLEEFFMRLRCNRLSPLSNAGGSSRTEAVSYPDRHNGCLFRLRIHSP